MRANFLTSLTVIALLCSVAAAEVYTVQYRGDLYSCELDGSNSAQLATGGSSERFRAIDATQDYVYVGLNRTSVGNGIVRYNLDGSGQTLISSNLVKDDSLTATDTNLIYLSGMDIHLADLDGSNDSVVYTLGSNLTAFWGNDLNVYGSSLYWVADNRRVQTCNLDGSGATQIFQVGSNEGLSSACVYDDYIYYAVDATSTIYRRDLDGSNETVLLTDTTMATGANSMQVADGQLYWTSDSHSLYSMDLTGGSASELYNFDSVFSSTSTHPIFLDVEIVPEPATLTLMAISALGLIKRRSHLRPH